MPPLVLLAIVGVGCYAGYKLFAKLIEQAQTPGREEVERVRREARAATGSTRNLGELEWDEKTGVYRPRGET
jgi:hypothetical protein